MANFSETETNFTFTDDTGKTATLPKDERWMLPGGVYEKAKQRFGTDLSGGNVIDPTNGGPMSGTMVATAAPESPAPPPPSGPFPTGQMSTEIKPFDPNAGAATMSAKPPGQVTAGMPTQGVGQATLEDENQSGTAVDANKQTGGMPTGPMMGTTIEDATQRSSLGQPAVDAMNNYEKIGNEAADLDAQALAQEKKVEFERRRAEEIELKKRNDAWALKRQAIDNEIERKNKEIEAKTQEFNSMSVTSDRYFGSEGSGSKVMAALGIALGALGTGLTGKDYNVAGILQKLVDNDIEAQKANISKAGQALEQQRGGLKDYMDITGSQDAAYHLETARILEGIGKQFDAVAAGSADAAVKAKAAQGKQLVAAKAMEAKVQGYKIVKTHTEQTAPMKGGAMLEDITDGVDTEVRQKIDGMDALAKIKAMKKDVDTGPIMGRILEVRAKGVPFVPLDEREAAFYAKYKGLMTQIAKAQFGLNVTDQQIQEVEKQIPNPKMTDEAFEAVLENKNNEFIDQLNGLEVAQKYRGKRDLGLDAQLEVRGLSRKKPTKFNKANKAK